MNSFRIPDWLIFTALFINMWIVCFSLIFGDWSTSLLGVFCIGCFIFTYKVNQWERNGKEEKDKKDS